MTTTLNHKRNRVATSHGDLILNLVSGVKHVVDPWTYSFCNVLRVRHHYNSQSSLHSTLGPSSERLLIGLTMMSHVETSIGWQRRCKCRELLCRQTCVPLVCLFQPKKVWRSCGRQGYIRLGSLILGRVKISSECRVYSTELTHDKSNDQASCPNQAINKRVGDASGDPSVSASYLSSACFCLTEWYA